MRIKRIILRVSVFLLLFLLVATVLSRTVYRLLLPQVNVAGVQTGALNNAVTFRCAIGLPMEDASVATPSDDETAEPAEKYAADASVSFDELQILLSPEYRLTGTAELLSEEGTASVEVSMSGYDYDSASGRFIAHFFVAGKDKPLEPGLPLIVTAKPLEGEETYLVPLGGVFPDISGGGGAPQYCVYTIEERRTMWGKETYLQKVTVTLEGSDFQYAAVSANALLKQVACYPSRPISDGDAVTVKKPS